MKPAKTVIAAAVMALACGVAFAKDGKDHKGFNDMDKNADGRLTRAEAAANKDLIGKWNDADTNKDGVLSRVEYLKVMAVKDANTVKRKVTGDDKQAKSSRKDDKDRMGFNEMDKNNDGRLTRAEAAGKQDLLGKWKEADKDNDGVLTRTEYLTVMAKKDANTAKQAVNREANEAKRRAPDTASTGTTTQNKSK